MTTISKDTGDGRSGGKIPTRRRVVRITPYDRPEPPSEGPNWLDGIIFPAKMVATGAGKILSSFWNPETWSSSPSSSSSSDIDSDTEEGEEERPDNGVIELDEENVTSTAIIKSVTKERQQNARKNETKYLIEQLILQETFSREECNRFIEVINSRVVDCSTKEAVDGGLETPSIRNEAITEAKQWFEEKKVGSSSKQLVKEGEASSPVDMAKSYMRSRPPWASPLKQNELRTPSPTGTGLFKDGALSMKKDNLSAGSWNIQDEIQRLRSKATEEILRSSRSMKIDAASLIAGDLANQGSLVAAKTIEINKLKDPNFLTKNSDVSVKPAERLSDQDPSALGMNQDDSHREALPSLPAGLVPAQIQVLEPAEMGEGVNDVSQPMETEVTEFKDTQAPYISACLQSSSPQGHETAQNISQPDEDTTEKQAANNLDLANTVTLEATTCELLTETFIEVPIVNEIIGRSQNGSTVPDEDLFQEAEVIAKPSLEDKAGEAKEKRATRYTRKTRGRGK